MRASAAYRLRTARNLLLKYFLEDSLPIEKTRILHDGEAA
jgi:xanthine dehydrogenase iron-sulfur cluster and FAD-binding subunit A